MTAHSPFLAAVVQASPITRDTSGTIDKLAALVSDCGNRRARLAVFPEAFVGGYPKGMQFGASLGIRTPEGRDEFRAYFNSAIAVPGSETETISTVARDNHLYLVVGVIERAGGTLYCTVLFFAPNGELV